MKRAGDLWDKEAANSPNDMVEHVGELLDEIRGKAGIVRVVDF